MPKKDNKNKVEHIFYNFTEYNSLTNSTDFYVYGEIISGGNDWKWDDTDVTFEDMRNVLDSVPDNSILNMYVNSPGGSVIATQGMIAMLRRAKDRGVTINAYADGICASCASWLIMVANNIYVYNSSILMIHKPMSMAYGNANDMKEQIAILDKIENDVMIPLYMSRAKEDITSDYLIELLDKETWLTSNDIINVFNVTLLEDTKQLTACLDKNIMKNYVNIPENIKELLKQDNSDNINNQDKIKEDKEDMAKDKQSDLLDNKKIEDVVIDDKSKKEDSNDIKDKVDEVDSKDNISADINDKINRLIDENLDLKELVDSMKPIVQAYNDKLEEEKNTQKELELTNLQNSFKDRFSKLHAEDKFESKEVQDLLKTALTNSEDMNKLNSIVIDLMDNKLEDTKDESTSKVVKYFDMKDDNEFQDIVPTNDGASKYGFR